ncbi:hypothetical protein MJO28_013276 [Puccinia striiformis f. sp. tritici]|nr:uncharacterized protein Pst134EA_031566 [Puccinia striiformis f. sp. tritici]XP_047800597.1 hypothetical protein Pst134EA_024265 [Puccinia striiformis f. sp. tritici]KAI9606721.1 hypothetical protein H4Q26_006258 [Puccinia striiformis f. sp. tritici PST-130]KNE90648.1 hypothetical protein PSTG_15910 [Puccinia striiformis f. sp. tritici PST-78]POW22908.1 hypothetical protein PSHT_00661 [Puccinia striiformis]KAH9442749.1 hypothetical protein Pst134EA_031566 [Puccinia striiformis f. sp. tritic
MDRWNEVVELEGEEMQFKVFAGYVPTRDEVSIKEAFATMLPKLQAKIDLYDRPDTWGKVVSPDFESLVLRIKTVLLPPLPRKICQMCDMLFSPIHSQNLEGPQLRAGMEILAEVEEIIDQMAAAMSLFWIPDPAPTPTLYRRKDMKRHRCERTQFQIVGLFIDLEEQLDQYYTLIPLCEFRTIMRRPVKYAWCLLVMETQMLADTMNGLIKWFDLSDFGILQDQWQEMAGEMDNLLEELVEFPTYNTNIRFQPLQEFIPILKLSRLFFDKISKRTNGETHPISEMSPDFLVDFLESTLILPQRIKDFFYAIEYQLVPQHDIDPQSVMYLIQIFQIPISHITGHLSLQLAQPDSPQGINEKLLSWYSTWQSQFSIAARRFQTTYKDVYSAFLIPN